MHIHWSPSLLPGSTGYSSPRSADGTEGCWARIKGQMYCRCVKAIGRMYCHPITSIWKLTVDLSDLHTYLAAVAAGNAFNTPCCCQRLPYFGDSEGVKGLLQLTLSASNHNPTP